MSEKGGYLQEQDLIEELRKEARMVYIANEGKVDELDCGIHATLLVLRRRALINDLGIQQIRKAGIKPPELPDPSKPQTTSL